MFPIVIFKILDVFVTILTADELFPVWNCENLRHPIEMQLSQKRKTFCLFLVPFLESALNFKHFKEKMIAIANVFPKLQTVKNFWLDHSL